MNSERSTKFAGAARFLLDECLKASVVTVETPFQDNWREEWERVTAECLYDFAGYLFSFLPPLVEAYSDAASIMRALPAIPTQPSTLPGLE